MSWTLLTLVACLLAADAKDGPVEAMAKELQGTWVVESFLVEGMEVEAMHGTKMIFEGVRMTFHIQQEPKTSTIEVDASQSPAHIDTINKGSDGVEHRSLGIFEIKDDKLRICSTRSPSVEGKGLNSKRPTAIDPKQGVVAVLKRAK
jgi:uncharacterized protein (TIGR03067 family)